MFKKLIKRIYFKFFNKLIFLIGSIGIRKLRKTSVIVSHRLNALKNCDTIYMVKNKEITLLKKNELKKYFEK